MADDIDEQLQAMLQRVMQRMLNAGIPQADVAARMEQWRRESLRWLQGGPPPTPFPAEFLDAKGEGRRMAGYHLYRIRDAHGTSTEWSFVVAQNQREAIVTYAARYPFADETTGAPLEPEDVTRAHVRIVEYALDRAYVLPDSWQSEPEDGD